MEPLIIDSTPKGSALLAYGAARGPRWNGRLLALIAGSLALMIAVLTAFLLLTRVTLPTNRLLQIAVQPHSIYARLEPTMRQDLPAPWRAAIETQSRLPSILGVALDETGHMHAFAFVARTASVANASSVHVTTDGPIRILTDGTKIAHEQMQLRRVVGLIHEAHGRDAAFLIRGDLLARLAGTAEESVSEIRGTWKGASGLLRLPSEEISISASGKGADLFAVPGDGSEHAPIIMGLLQQGADLRNWSVFPEALALRSGTEGGLFLSWNQPLPLPESRLLAARRGLGELRPLTLPDQTEIMELHPGAASTTAPIAEIWLPFAENSVPLPSMPPDLQGTSSTTTTGSLENTTCPGRVRFSLQRDSLASMLTAWGVPISWKNRIHGFELSENANGVHICIK